MYPGKKQKFHIIVAQLLYILKRVKPDLAPVVLFLTARVCEPADDDWLNLRYVVEYLCATKDLCLILQVEKSTNSALSIDAAHQVHDDCKGRTCVEVLMWVKDLFFTVSCKHKFNTKSSTEVELVAVYDCMSDLL